MHIDARVLESIDLNSLLTFLLVYQEHSVSRAAECLHVKQPAVSNTLARLREYFADPLFVRHATGVIPTRRAHCIAEELAPAFVQIQTALARQQR
ncbi:LysR family transcriptional regulator [Pseudomonas sp. NPDC089734]|uniref:LysR family transcriptional regulator n=1 Tax=Pseudomonas sp. NPDC089734 TaxID=3364469 RepID=UPI00382BE670